MISRTKVNRKLERKTNPELVETILKSEKLKNWLKVAHYISGPTRLHVSINLDQIGRETKEGDTVVIPGKVLSMGSIGKKIRIAALGFSKQAREKLKADKCEIVSIKDEIKINPTARGIKVLGR